MPSDGHKKVLLFVEGLNCVTFDEGYQTTDMCKRGGEGEGGREGERERDYHGSVGVCLTPVPGEVESRGSPRCLPASLH